MPVPRPLRLLAALLLALAAALAQPSQAQAPAPAPGFVSPLEPLDTSSPRATLLSLRQLGAGLDSAYAAYLEDPSFRLQREIREVLARTDRLFDLGQTAPAARREAGAASFGLLKDILMRLPEIDPASLPGDGAAAPDRVRLPGTEIEIVRVPDGPDRGAFLFSADTVARLPGFHARVIDLPILNPAPYESWHAEQVRFTGPLVPAVLLRAMPDALQALVLGTPAWKAMLTVAILGLTLALAALWAGRALGRAARMPPVRAQLMRLTAPLVLGGLVLVARAYVLGQVNVTGRFFALVNTVTLVIAVACVAWLARSLWVLLGEWVMARSHHREDAFDEHLVQMLARVAGLLSAAAVLVYGANELGVPVLGLVAGVGVGGLALALAAQSTIENLFGGVSIFADRPFRVGDFIIYEGGEGYVESIGPRSTRIRALDGMQITVPNADLAKMQVTNKTCRDATLFRHVIPLHQESGRAQLADFAGRMLAEMRDGYPLDPAAELPPRVRVVALGADSVDVEIRAELLARDEDDFCRLQESLLLTAAEQARACGLRFAEPVQTILLAGAPGAAPPIDLSSIPRQIR